MILSIRSAVRSLILLNFAFLCFDVAGANLALRPRPVAFLTQYRDFLSRFEIYLSDIRDELFNSRA
jgi:hypothetical protein